MAIWAIIEGNLAKNPVLQTVKVEGEPRKLVELLVFSDVGRRVDGQWVQNEDKSGLVEITIWSEKLGDAVFQHLKKGARVQIQGDLHLNRYTDSNGKESATLRMEGDSVALLLYRIESITFKPPRGAQQAAPAAPAEA